MSWSINPVYSIRFHSILLHFILYHYHFFSAPMFVIMLLWFFRYSDFLHFFPFLPFPSLLTCLLFLCLFFYSYYIIYQLSECSMSSAEFFGQKPTTFDPFTGGITVLSFLSLKFFISTLFLFHISYFIYYFVQYSIVPPCRVQSNSVLFC